MSLDSLRRALDTCCKLSDRHLMKYLCALRCIDYLETRIAELEEELASRGR